MTIVDSASWNVTGIIAVALGIALGVLLLIVGAVFVVEENWFQVHVIYKVK